MATILLKSDPEEYGFDDLEREGQAAWNGVRNALAQRYMRAARRGDDVLFYHTGRQRALVGLAAVESEPYEDPDSPGRTADGLPRHPVFDIVPIKRALTPVALTAIRSDTRFADFLLLRQTRLSVIPVPDDLALLLKEMAGLLGATAGRRSRGLSKLGRS